MTQDEFVAKANQVHDNKYDYSETIFIKCADYVTIKCPEHGYFTQTANSHLMGHGCPECGRKYQFNSEEEKQANYASRTITRQKTCIDRYGVSNPMQVNDMKERMIDTVMEKYGVCNVANLREVKDKRRRTNIERYGATSYLSSDAGQAHMKAIMLDKYGVDNYAKSDEYIERNYERLIKYKATQIERYGAEHYSQSEDYKRNQKVFKEREYETKRRNHSFNASQPEKIVYERLFNIFGENDVTSQYHDHRYPFLCDFYVISRDMFIELNLLWTHGGHWYDLLSDDDRNIVAFWFAKGTKYYRNAIDTWTRRDVNKRTTAMKNALNYVTFWDVDLSDFNEWVTAGCPDGKDWDRMYSWK